LAESGAQHHAMGHRRRPRRRFETKDGALFLVDAYGGQLEEIATKYQLNPTEGPRITASARAHACKLLEESPIEHADLRKMRISRFTRVRPPL